MEYFEDVLKTNKLKADFKELLYQFPTSIKWFDLRLLIRTISTVILKFQTNAEDRVSQEDNRKFKCNQHSNFFFSIPYHCSSMALFFVLEYLAKNFKRAAHSFVASSTSSLLYVSSEVKNQPLFPLKSNPIVHFSDTKWFSDKCELIIA